MSPPEPLALRLTANLMIGVLRVYGQQYQMHYAEVQGLWARLSRSEAEEKHDIYLAVKTARPEAITVPLVSMTDLFQHNDLSLLSIPSLMEAATPEKQRENVLQSIYSEGLSSVTKLSSLNFDFCSKTSLSSLGIENEVDAAIPFDADEWNVFGAE